MKRFADHSAGEILAKRANIVPKNTVNANKGASSLFRCYLEEKSQNTNFETFDPVRLAEHLSHFYMDVRTKDGEMYKATSLESMRHSLNRYLKAPPHLRPFDIITANEFNDANACFKTAMAEVKASGKGDIEHYPVINNPDLRKLYSSVQFLPHTPVGLANRVQMNIRLYFCRRANENMEKMTKSTFDVKVYPETKQKYVVKVLDELSKNHRGSDKEKVSGHMPSMPESPDVCPVTTFEKYLAKLNPASDRLWQYPKDSFEVTDDCWYQNRPIGRDSLSKFMGKLSAKVNLSQIYTNHSIRVTGASILSTGNYSASQIMSVTGHKSVSSLAVYQRVSDQEKHAMGSAITSTITGREQQLALPPARNMMSIAAGPSSRDLIPSPNSAVSADINLAMFDGVDIENLLCDFDAVPATQRVSNTMNSVQYERNNPVFQNCTIQNVNFYTTGNGQ